MNKFFNYFSYAPKHFLMGLIAAALVFIPTAVIAGFGPDRPTIEYTGAGTPGADHVTFNSFTNVPNVGDERNFFHGLTTPGGVFHDPVTVNDGDEVLVRVYVHNNADASLNESGEGVAKNVRVRVDLPTDVAKRHEATAYISADNAQPKEIWDTLDFQSGHWVALDYVEGSATIKTNFMDRALSDDIVKGGVLIGDDALDGEMNGCFKYVALVTFKVKVHKPQLEIEKTVRELGETTWQETATGLEPGDKVEYRLKVTNAGSTTVDDIIVGDNLPPYMSYVQDTTMAYDSIDLYGRDIGNNITTGGVKLNAKYAPGAVVYVIFQAEVDHEIDRCGTVTLTNVGLTRTTYTSNVEDTAVIKVATGNSCEQETPEYRCTGLDVQVLDREARQVEATASVEMSDDVTLTGVSIDFGDGTVVNENGATHTYAADGNYTINATVSFDVNGDTKTDHCSDTVKFDTEEEPCEYDPTLGKDDPNCVPPELPNTGPGATLAAIFGTGAVTAAGRNFVASRRALKESIKDTLLSV